MNRTLFAALLLLAPSLNASEVVFQEDFEAFSPGAPVTEELGTNRWRITGFASRESPGQATIVTGEGFNSSLVARTTPENAEGRDSGTSMSIVASFPEVSGKMRFTTRLYSEYGSSQVVLRFEHEKTVKTAVQLLFRTSPRVELVAMGTKEGETAPQIPLGSYDVKRWYELVLTLDPEQRQFDLELIDLEKENAMIAVQGLDLHESVPAINNLILGAIFGTRSAWHWDDVKAEKLP